MLHCAFCTTAGVVVRWYFGSSEFSSRGSSTKARSREITAEMRPRCAEFSSREIARDHGRDAPEMFWLFNHSHTHTTTTAQAVLCSLGQTLRYSLGSLVVGSLLMIPGRIFRFFLEHCLHQARFAEIIEQNRRDHRSKSPRS